MSGKDIFSLLKNNLRSVSTMVPKESSNKVSKLQHTSEKKRVIKNINELNVIRSSNITSSTKAINGNVNDRWKITGSWLIHNTPRKIHLSRYHDSTNKVKIAAFDLDGTLVNTKSGGSFARHPNDWKWWNKEKEESKVIQTLQKLIKDNYLLVIFTNQGGVIANNDSKSYLNFINRVNNIVKDLRSNTEDDFDILIYASPKKPLNKKIPTSKSTDENHKSMRKPMIGMWENLVKFLKTIEGENENEQEKVHSDDSFYVGDAAGRPGDFASSDKDFAKNANVKFMVPEEIFT